MPEWVSQVGGASAPVLAAVVFWLWREYVRLARALAHVQEQRVKDMREMIAALGESAAAQHEAARAIERLGGRT